MIVVFKKKMYSGFPTPVASHGTITLTPRVYVLFRKVDNAYIKYKQNLGRVGLLWEYLKVYSIWDVFAKARSRSSEKIRNDKYLVGGVGITDTGEHYYFLHTAAQFFQSTIVVDQMLVQKIDGQLFLPPSLLFAKSLKKVDWIEQLAGYSFNSGNFPPEKSIAKGISDVIVEVNRLLNGQCKITSFDQLPKKRLRFEKPSLSATNNAVLFGLGNHAKTIILPNLPRKIKVARVHEIDPVQFLGSQFPQISTSPLPDFKTHFPFWFIAGWHHTHTSLAIEALRRNAIPIIEKPLCTTNDDFIRFKAALNSNSQFFVCFQKRYDPFNAFIFNDFNFSRGESPIHYKALVYEIPLSKNHWYNWKNSGSRIVSNGCHWIDQFMFLNGFPDVSWVRARLEGATYTLELKLANGAYGIIILSETGSNRIGTRDYVELSIPGATVVLQDSLFYRSENNNRIIRQMQRRSKLDPLKKMYREIADALMKNTGCDSLDSLKSSEAMLILEQELAYKTPSQFNPEIPLDQSLH